MLNLDDLHRALEAGDFSDVAREALRPLKAQGLAHDHVALGKTGVLARVPKQSQFGYAAADNLAYQAACFERVSASGHGPRLYGVLQPSELLPMGALLVEEIDGRPLRLPEDLPATAEAMAAVHSLPVPPEEQRPPLENHRDPVAGAMAEIEGQAEFIPEAGLEPSARAEIERELAWARDFAASLERPQPLTLVLTDTHPGNFLVRPDGTAVIVDLEKALYGSPGTDLAHHTVYSSTTWDTEVYAELSREQVAAFYRRYLDGADPALAAALRPWLIPMRRITWLRAITWCVKWSVAHRKARLEAKQAAESTEDWSAENTDPALIAHVADRVATYLSPEILRRMTGEWREEPLLDELIG